MFCSNCGNEITEFDRFCAKCGSEVSHSKPDAPVTSTEAQDVSVQSDATEQVPAGEPVAPESPAAPAPTPISEAAPTAPTPTAPTPAASAYTQEVTPFTTVPQAPDQELVPPPKKKSRVGLVVAIGVGVTLIALLIAFVVVPSIQSPSSSTGGNTGTEVDEGYSSDTEDDWNDLNVVDSNDNVTGYACINLNGEDLAEVLLDNGYYWSSASECYLRSSDLAAVGFMDATGNLLDEDEILALQEGAANEPIMIVNSVGGYSSVSSAFNGALGVSLSDSTYGDDELLLGLVENDYGQQYLVMTFAHGDGTYDLCFINDLGVEEGLFFNLTGVSGYTTVSEVWSAITSGSFSLYVDSDDTVTTTAASSAVLIP